MIQASVVIPTRSRETRLAFALDALSAQTLPQEAFEVIVVRTTEATPGPLTEAPAGLDVRFLTSAAAGTAVQRNIGWRAAQAPLVVFTDDDCRASEGWLESLLAGARPGGIVQGRTGPDPDELHHMHGLARTIRVERPPSWYETCNIAYPRDLLERLGGFDERFGFLGEDADLGCRAQDAGVELDFIEEAVVWHAVHRRSLPDALRDAWKRRSFPDLVKRHPRLRAQLWLGFISDLDHARLIGAVLGLSAWRASRPLAIAATIPYLKRRVDPRRLLNPWGLARTPIQLGSRVVVDLVETGLFVSCSLRARTLVI